MNGLALSSRWNCLSVSWSNLFLLHSSRFPDNILNYMKRSSLVRTLSHIKASLPLHRGRKYENMKKWCTMPHCITKRISYRKDGWGYGTLKNSWAKSPQQLGPHPQIRSMTTSSLLLDEKLFQCTGTAEGWWARLVVSETFQLLSHLHLLAVPLNQCPLCRVYSQ